MSIIEEGYCKMVRMASLAVIGSHTVNGVAAIHSELMKQYVFKSFNQKWPEKFQNKTNGVMVWRWLHHCNPGLLELITRAVGSENWALTADGLTVLAAHAANPEFRAQWASVKLTCKQRLADWISAYMGVTLNPETTIFDIQVKRIHEYKRQALNTFTVIDRYLRITDGDIKGLVPRATFIGGKAAPGYFFAKKLIKLINNVARVVNSDPRAEGLLKVLYLPNYNVSLAEIIIPGADINQQISTSGTEASGTSNMKFAFNSSLIVRTWDGANIEIGEAAGGGNVFFFGAKADEVDGLRATASERALNPRLKRVFDTIKSGLFGDPNEYQCIWQSVEGRNHYLVNVDFQAYLDIQAAVDLAYTDKDAWVTKGITQTANMGRFSSDRIISEYAEQIWRITPHPVPVPEEEAEVAPPRAQSAERIGSATRRHQVATRAPTPTPGGRGVEASDDDILIEDR